MFEPSPHQISRAYPIYALYVRGVIEK